METKPAFDISPEKRASKLQFFYRQLFVRPPPVLLSQADLSGRTAIITGANSGLGLETAQQLLALGCKVILAVRNANKGAQALEELTNRQRITEHGMIEVWSLDLASYPSIVAFAERAGQLAQLDIAVLNAGIWCVEESFTAEGYEQTVQVNYLANMLLAMLLLPIVRNKRASRAPGRIVVVSSDVAAWAKFHERRSEPLLAAFKRRMAKWDDTDRYGTSKLLGQLFISELARRVPSTEVTISCANCGLCRGSGLGRQFVGVSRLVLDLMYRLIGRECSVGARTFVHAVTTLGQESHGNYIEDAKVQPMAPLLYTVEGRIIAMRLFDETVAELSFAGVEKIVNHWPASSEALREAAVN